MSFPNEFKFFHNRVDSNGDEILIGGDDDGQVWDLMDSSNLGDGASATPFHWTLWHNQLEFGSRGRLKEIDRMVVYSEGIQNGTVFCRTHQKKNFEPLRGTINDEIAEIMHDLKGNYFEYRIQGRGVAGQIIGFDFPEPDIKQSYRT